MDPRLDGKTILVAGAGGIGNALARRYAAEGAAVVIGDVNKAVAEKAASAIVANGQTAVAVELDGADEGSIAAAIDLVVTQFGRLDGLNANFATFPDATTGCDVTTLSLDMFDEIMRINMRGYMLCTRHAVPAMAARGGGSIVYTSSAAAYLGEPQRLSYAMSKAAGHALMRHVASTFGKDGIRANAIAPGFISHGQIEAMLGQEYVDGVLAQTAIKARLGRPADIAAMSALLMSDDGAYVTGQIISVDGGVTMRA